MTAERTEGVAIARLYGRDPMKIIGRVYYWNTEELTILRLERKRPVRFIDPPIDRHSFCPRLEANREVFATIAAAQARSVTRS